MLGSRLADVTAGGCKEVEEPPSCMCKMQFLEENCNSACHAGLVQNTGHTGKVQKTAEPFPPILMPSPHSFSQSPCSPHSTQEHSHLSLSADVNLCFTLWQLQCVCEMVCGEGRMGSPRKAVPGTDLAETSGVHLLLCVPC